MHHIISYVQLLGPAYGVHDTIVLAPMQYKMQPWNTAARHDKRHRQVYLLQLLIFALLHQL
jgi:hypothetical protein